MTALVHFHRYSNRSATNAELGKWVDCLEDATMCLKLRPDWFKSYYRCVLDFLVFLCMRARTNVHTRVFVCVCVRAYVHIHMCDVYMCNTSHMC